MKGKLFLVSTPIGNYEDITLRALKVLKNVDLIVCEEFKEARRLLSNFDIEKDLLNLNEHNEKEASNEVVEKLIAGKNIALISDCGTPVFSDPGKILVDLCIQNEIKIVPIPGASSLLAALVASGADINKFYYYGWLSPKKDLRRKQLLDLKKKKETIVIMETPYRLKTLLTEVSKILGSKTNCILAFELTTDNENFFRGTAAQLVKIVEEKKLKGEFVLILENS
jgi:16S rRNA (cytidine1402-2'-O)-methyltransferase